MTVDPPVMLHRDDCLLIRDDDTLFITDVEGFIVASMPGSFTAPQAWLVLDQMNRAYGKGHQHGKVDKAEQIRLALYIAGGSV